MTLAGRLVDGEVLTILVYRGPFTWPANHDLLTCPREGVPCTRMPPFQTHQSTLVPGRSKHGAHQLCLVSRGSDEESPSRHRLHRSGSAKGYRRLKGHSLAAQPLCRTLPHAQLDVLPRFQDSTTASTSAQPWPSRVLPLPANVWQNKSFGWSGCEMGCAVRPNRSSRGQLDERGRGIDDVTCGTEFNHDPAAAADDAATDADGGYTVALVVRLHGCMCVEGPKNGKRPLAKLLGILRTLGPSQSRSERLCARRRIRSGGWVKGTF